MTRVTPWRPANGRHKARERTLLPRRYQAATAEMDHADTVSPSVAVVAPGNGGKTMRTVSSAAALLLAGAVLAMPPGAHAAPKKGKATFDAYVTWHYTKTIESGVDTGQIGEATGFDVLVKGDPGFPDIFTFTCVGTFRDVGEDRTGTGHCVKTDKDGDDFSYVFTISDGFTWEGGTGKYKGMSGGGTARATWRHALPNGDWAAVIRHEATFEIP